MDDLIKRKDAILMIQRHGVGCFDADEFHPEEAERFVIGMLEKLPSAEPEIIYCKDCKRHNVDIGGYREENGKRHWYWKDEACPLVGYRGKAQGHEYDYQFCVYAERRTDE